MGGLGLKSLKKLNQAAVIKLAWEMLTSIQDWADFYRSRFGKSNTPSKRYFKSSIWHEIKNFRDGNLWTIPAMLANKFPQIAAQIYQTTCSATQDQLIWEDSNDGIKINSDGAAHGCPSHAGGAYYGIHNVLFEELNTIV
ncbi:hypothetical protein Lal_00041846 [Lupinus albus]|nr:hypothetical protein Lal_00041846 [Lupinus albus]